MFAPMISCNRAIANRTVGNEIQALNAVAVALMGGIDLVSCWNRPLFRLASRWTRLPLDVAEFSCGSQQES